MSAMESRTLAPNVRAAVSTAVCTLLAVAAHRAAMAGAGVPVAAVVIGAVVVFCFARVAAGLGERGLGTIGVLVGGSQVALHLLFTAFRASDSPAGAASAAGMGDMAGMANAPSTLGPAHMPGTASVMTIAHVLAAVAAAWWLRRGEAALFAAVERAGAVLGVSWRMVARWIVGTRLIRPPGPAAPVAGWGRHQPAVARVLLFTVIRRGPPKQDWLFSD